MTSVMHHPIPTQGPSSYRQAITQWETAADEAVVLDAYCAGEYRINHDPGRFFLSVTDRRDRPLPLSKILEANRGDETTIFLLLGTELHFPVRIALIPA